MSTENFQMRPPEKNEEAVAGKRLNYVTANTYSFAHWN